MITVAIVNVDGEKVGETQIDPLLFGDKDGNVNKQLMHDAVVMYHANKRVGTHYAKRRGDVVGSKRKLYRQKGTGHARQGAKRQPVRRGGGTAHGPRPRDYSYAMPKKARRLATRMAFLSKFRDEEAVVLDSFAMDEPKTRRMNEILGKLGLLDQGLLVATTERDRNIYLSARNIERVEVLPQFELNTWALLRYKRLLITRDALEAFTNWAKAYGDEASEHGDEGHDAHEPDAAPAGATGASGGDVAEADASGAD